MTPVNTNVGKDENIFPLCSTNEIIQYYSNSVKLLNTKNRIFPKFKICAFIQITNFKISIHFLYQFCLLKSAPIINNEIEVSSNRCQVVTPLVPL